MELDESRRCPMYKMRPIVPKSEEIEYPPCVYRMKVIQDSCWWHSDPNDREENDELMTTILEQVNQFLKKPPPEAVALESRQEAILAQLADLKKQLNSLREHLKKPHLDSAHSIQHSSAAHSKNGLTEEIVIKASPRYPPYSLLAFYKSSHNGLNIHNHIHSGTNCLSHDLVKQFEKNSVTSPLLNIRLIWKNVADTEMVVSPTKHSVIRGEVNMLRFLSRVGPTHLNYELYGDHVLTSIADNLLDVCHQLLREKTAKAKQAHLKVLSAQLQKSQFLIGQAISIVDMAAWSALKQIGYTTSKDLSAGVGRWFQTCNEIFEIAL